MSARGGGELSVRRSILGNIQQGGRPSPFDRIQATRLAAKTLEHLVEQIERGETGVGCIGRWGGKIAYTGLEHVGKLMQHNAQRPIEQPWLELRQVVKAMEDETE